MFSVHPYTDKYNIFIHRIYIWLNDYADQINTAFITGYIVQIN